MLAPLVRRGDEEKSQRAWEGYTGEKKTPRLGGDFNIGFEGLQRMPFR